MKQVLFVFGTRPEAIKLAPVIRQLQSQPDLFRVVVCVTAQHRGMLDQVLAAFRITPDFDLDVMKPGQTLFQSTSRILAGLEPVMAASKPDWVVVQGDTTSTLCGALAGFYQRVSVAHVEAGLRTGDPNQPFPEEMNRLLTTRLSRLHFAATSGAAENLKAENVLPESIHVTGNPGIDAVLHVRGELAAGRLPGFEIPSWDASRPLILVTAHRRESFGAALLQICAALRTLAEQTGAQILFPVHPNPAVKDTVERELGGRSGLFLIPPLEYVAFVDCMRRATILLTDSGGVQEEGTSLGKPILVMRDKTERPEGVSAGSARLVGTDPARILAEVRALLQDDQHLAAMSQARDVYGDGRASERIAAVLASA